MKRLIRILLDLSVLGGLLLLLSVVFFPSFAGVFIPSLSAQQSKVKESGARNNIGISMKVQQENFKEKGSFVFRFSDLQMGIEEETEDYRYRVSKVQGSQSVVAFIAQPKSSGKRAYVAIMFISSGANGFACESYDPTTSFPDLSTIIVPNRETGRIVVTGDDMPPHTTVMCPKGYRTVNRENDGFSNP